MSFQGIIFDMDGTITEPYLDFVKIREEMDVGEHDLIEYLKTVTGPEHDRLHAIQRKYERKGVENARLNRGARELLDFLEQHKLPTALLTRNSRESVDGVCRKLDLRFDIAVSREDGPHKPSPEPIWQIAKRWKAKPGELLMVGDYMWDLLCAKNAGTPCAVLTNGDGVPDWAREAEFVIGQLTELIDIIRGRSQEAVGGRQ